jgi:hypothetical protein
MSRSILRTLSAIPIPFLSTRYSSQSSTALPAMTTPTYRQIPYNPPSSSKPRPTPEELTPHDPSPSSIFYTQPRLCNHIDDNAIANLTIYYEHNLPKKGRILDLCTSWVSHYPKSFASAIENGELIVYGMGMNDYELRKNPIMKDRWIVKDLNLDPTIPNDIPTPGTGSSLDLDSTTCTVSIDYLTQPIPVLSSILRSTKQGGSVHLIISNRCFPTKVVGKWLQMSEMERLGWVGDLLVWSGWGEVEVLEICKGGWGKDPLWCVRGKKM